MRLKRLGVPQESRDAFAMLHQAGVLSGDLSEHLQAMVGFRNVAVHDYRKLNPDILRNILQHRISDFLAFSKIILRIAL